jgi:hypothetical protein
LAVVLLQQQHIRHRLDKGGIMNETVRRIYPSLVLTVSLALMVSTVAVVPAAGLALDDGKRSLAGDAFRTTPTPSDDRTSAIVTVEPELDAQMAADGSAGYLIYFREQPDLSPAFEMGWRERGRFVVDALRETAGRSQANVRAYLDAQGADYRSFWIDNGNTA